MSRQWTHQSYCRRRRLPGRIVVLLRLCYGWRRRRRASRKVRRWGNKFLLLFRHVVQAFERLLHSCSAQNPRQNQSFVHSCWLVQSERKRTRLRTKRNVLFAEASPTHINFRSQCRNLSDTFSRQELRFAPSFAYATWYAQYHVNALSSGSHQSGVLYSETALQVFALNRWFSNALHSPLVQFCLKHFRHLKTLVIDRALLEHHTEAKNTVSWSVQEQNSKKKGMPLFHTIYLIQLA